MQSACTTCGYRGHGSGKCKGNRDILADIYKFEKFADIGCVTRFRNKGYANLWQFGFYYASITLVRRNYQDLLAQRADKVRDELRQEEAGIVKERDRYAKAAEKRRKEYGIPEKPKKYSSALIDILRDVPDDT
jgi:hypothetical protein